MPYHQTITNKNGVCAVIFMTYAYDVSANGAVDQSQHEEISLKSIEETGRGGGKLSQKLSNINLRPHRG